MRPGRDLVIPMIALNHGVRAAYPRVVIEREDPADVALTSQALRELVPLGLRVRADEVRALLGLEAPDDDDEVLTPPAAAQLPAPTATARESTALARAARERDAIDEAVAAALAQEGWEPMMAPLVEPILAAARATVEAGEGPEEFRRRLPALLGEMDDAALARTLHRLGFGAALAARVDSDR